MCHVAENMKGLLESAIEADQRRASDKKQENARLEAIEVEAQKKSKIFILIPWSSKPEPIYRTYKSYVSSAKTTGKKAQLYLKKTWAKDSTIDRPIEGAIWEGLHISHWIRYWLKYGRSVKPHFKARCSWRWEKSWGILHGKCSPSSQWPRR